MRGKIMWQNTKSEFMCECVGVGSYMCSGPHAGACVPTQIEAGVRCLPQLMPTLFPQTGSPLNLLLTDSMGLDWLVKGEHDQNTLNEIAKKTNKKIRKKSFRSSCLCGKASIWHLRLPSRPSSWDLYRAEKNQQSHQMHTFTSKLGLKSQALNKQKLGSECPWPTASPPSRSSSSSTEDMWMFL